MVTASLMGSKNIFEQIETWYGFFFLFRPLIADDVQPNRLIFFPY